MRLDSFFYGLAQTVTGMEVVLCVVAGLLAAYWDGAYCERRGWRREARFVRRAGLSIAIAGTALYVLGIVGRWFTT